MEVVRREGAGETPLMASRRKPRQSISMREFGKIILDTPAPDSKQTNALESAHQESPVKSLFSPVISTWQPTLPPPPQSAIGRECLDLALKSLSADEMSTMLTYPEAAITLDLPTILFFNKDHRETNGTCFMIEGHLKVAKKACTAVKWRDAVEVEEVLSVLGKHMKKIYELVQRDQERYSLGALDLLLVKEYIRAVDTGKDIHVSENLSSLYNRVDDHVISVSRMCQRLSKTLTDACSVPVGEWISAAEYASQVLSAT